MKNVMWIIVGYLILTTTHAATDTEKSDIKQVTQIATAFAESHILGTGAFQHLTRIRDITGDSATVFIGESNETGDDPETYKVNLKRIGGKWKVVTYEFAKIGTTGDLKRIIRRVDMHGSLFPSLQLDRLVESNGGTGYFKQFPNELDKNEVPISLMQRSQFITVDIIKKHKIDSVVIGAIQKGKQAETRVTVYGLSENDISKYLQEISSEMPLVSVAEVNQIDACGKSIVKAKLSITARQDQLSIPGDQGTTKLSFEIDGQKFGCILKDDGDVVPDTPDTPPLVKPTYAEKYSITVEKLEAFNIPEFYIGLVKATNDGARLVAYTTSSRNVAEFMRKFADLSTIVILRDLRRATALEVKVAAECGGTQLGRAELEIHGDNKLLVELNPNNNLVEIRPELGNTKQKCKTYFN